MALWLQVRYWHLLGVWWVFITDMLIFFFLILHDKIYRNTRMPDHAYTPEAIAIMLKSLKIGLKGHRAN